MSRAEHADRARPQQACRRDRWVFHLHPDNARFGLGRVVLGKLLGSLLDLFERTGFFARPALDQRRDASRPSRQLVDDRQRLVLERIGPSQDHSQRHKDHERGADPARHPTPFQRVHRRVERVKQQQTERQRREQRLHVVQQEDGDAERDDEQRNGFRVEIVEERDLGRICDRRRRRCGFRQFMYRTHAILDTAQS